MIINHPIALVVLDIIWLGFVAYVWYLVFRRSFANRNWKRVPGKVTHITVMGYLFRPYAACIFTFRYEGKEIKGFDLVATTSVKKLKNAQMIQIAVNEENPKKSIVCDTGWPLYGIPVFLFAIMTALTIGVILMQLQMLLHG